jgi:hypothetical protein
MSVRHFQLRVRRQRGSPAATASRERGSVFLSRRKNTQAIYAAIRGCDNLDAKTCLFQQHNFAGQRNAALDLAHKATYCRSLVLPVDFNSIPE